jgi:hypothetical protein
MLLYHYSDIDINGELLPEFFGSNFFSNNSQRVSNCKRIFFYTQDKEKEHCFNGNKFLYICYIDNKKIYDIEADNQGIVKNLSRGEDIYLICKQKGFDGIKGNNGLDVIALFYPITYIEKRKL